MPNQLLPHTPAEPPAHSQVRSLAEVEALISGAQPALPPDMPEYQAAVLLLMARDVGLNVDRLARRTKLPREFIAHGLRRLADNGLWVEGHLRTSWCESAASCSHFWLDVDVVLGRCLRRLDSAGRPEWGCIGEWVKDFNYHGMRDAGTPISNEYLEIAPYNPEPEPLYLEEEDEAPEPVRPEELPESRTDLSRSPALPGSPAASWMGGPEEPRGEPEAARAAIPSVLIDEWAGANWLR